MISQQDIDAVISAAQNKLQITLTYTKKTTGEVVTHTGGIYEVGVDDRGQQILYLWDTVTNDYIRKFLIENIQSIQILDIPFLPPQSWPIKINGQIIGY